MEKPTIYAVITGNQLDDTTKCQLFTAFWKPDNKYLMHVLNIREDEFIIDIMVAAFALIPDTEQEYTEMKKAHQQFNNPFM